MSFEKLSQRFQLLKQDFFRFLQIRNYILKDTSLCHNRSLSPIEKVLFQIPGEKSVSQLYKILKASSEGNVTFNSRLTWERELSVSISEDDWINIWKYAKSISVCNRAKAIQFKILHRMHISPNRRHAFNNSLSPLCLKCKSTIPFHLYVLSVRHKLVHSLTVFGLVISYKYIGPR